MQMRNATTEHQQNVNQLKRNKNDSINGQWVIVWAIDGVVNINSALLSLNIYSYEFHVACFACVSTKINSTQNGQFESLMLSFAEQHQ